MTDNGWYCGQCKHWDQWYWLGSGMPRAKGDCLQLVVVGGLEIDSEFVAITTPETFGCVLFERKEDAQ